MSIIVAGGGGETFLNRFLSVLTAVIKRDADERLVGFNGRWEVHPDNLSNNNSQNNIELKAVECIDVINIFFRSGLRSLNLDVGI